MGESEPVTLHVLMFPQGHHKEHGTEFVLTSEAGDPERPEDVIARITYPVRGVQRDFIEQVARDMDVILFESLTIHSPRGWLDHVSYRGRRVTRQD